MSVSCAFSECAADRGVNVDLEGSFDFIGDGGLIVSNTSISLSLSPFCASRHERFGESVVAYWDFRVFIKVSGRFRRLEVIVSSMDALGIHSSFLFDDQRILDLSASDSKRKAGC